MNKIIIKYLRDKKNRPTACVALRKTESGFYFGWSKCHKKDVFIKKRAVQIALSRLEVYTCLDKPLIYVSLPRDIRKALEFYVRRLSSKFKVVPNLLCGCNVHLTTKTEESNA